MVSVLTGAIAESTKKSYKTAFKAWPQYKLSKIPKFSKDEVFLALFITQIAKTVKVSTAANYAAGVVHSWRLHGYKGDGMASSLVKLVLRGLKILQNHESKHTEPFLLPIYRFNPYYFFKNKIL